jgi:hypothetical protein
VQVDHDGIRIELVRELDRVQSVLGGACDRQDRLMLDERAKGLEEVAVVVHEEDAHRYRNRPVRLFHGRTLALLR